MGSFDVTYVGALGAGLISFLSPCVLPLVPPYLCFLGGITFNQLENIETSSVAVRHRIIFASITFVLGFSTVFIALGATASWLGQFISNYLTILSQIAGVIIIILGIHFTGLFRILALFRDLRFNISEKPAGLLGAYIVGLAFAFGWTPCVGPVLATILFVAGGESSVTHGAGLLAAYSLGIGIPFIITGFAVGPFLGLMKKLQKHLGALEKAVGLVLILTGTLFVTGGFNSVGYWMLEIFPSFGQVG